MGSLRCFGALCLCIGFGTHFAKGGRSPKRHLGNLGFEGGPAVVFGLVLLQSCSRSCTSILGELLLRSLVPHRIAPGEFLSGGLFVQAPVFQFHSSSPSSSAPEGPNVARPSRSVEKLTPSCELPSSSVYLE